MAQSHTTLNEEKGEDFHYEFTQEQLHILFRNGVSPAVALCLLAESNDVLCSLRGNDSEKLPSMQRLSNISYPKPGSIQAKSCNVGPASSFVAIDPRYSKAEKTEGGIKPYPRKEGDLPENQPKVAAPISVQELIADVAKGEYVITSAEDGVITFKLSPKAAENAPDEVKNDEYEIQLNRDKGTPPLPIENKEALGISNTILPKPDWWDEDELGSYKDVAEYSFPLQYRKSDQERFSDFLIAAEKFKGQLAPVISDHDQFIIAFAKDYLNNIIEKKPEMNEPIYAMNGQKEKIKDLVEKLIKIEIYKYEQATGEKFDHENNNKHAAILNKIEAQLSDNDKLVKGNITPLESYYSNGRNKKFAEAMPHIAHFFQHASEARNPYLPSKMGRVVFFMNREIYEVTGPKEISNFLLNKAMPKFRFDIHPKWDMNYFGPVVAKQLELGHRVLPETQKSYETWLNESKPEKSVSSQRGRIARAPSVSYSSIREQAAKTELEGLKTQKEPSDGPSFKLKQ
ncbi:MAG TPA: hypothetical protein VHA13_05290 [Gammaproteobacteria bacterium]|nr:hypothetical protein [Gammaproteobacteria bacterium]